MKTDDFARIDTAEARPGGKKLYIKSFGCQMNAYDATRMADVLAPEGFEETPDPGQADLIVLNTCHIREKAAEKVFSELGRLRQLKQEREAAGQATVIAVAGCVAQAQGAEILRKQRAVDIVVGPQNYHRLPELLRQTSQGPVADTEFPVEDKFAFLIPPRGEKIRERGVSAFLTVQEGCDKFCSFCVVPYTRGAEISRPVAQIMAEAETFAKGGVREITLLGQNVNAYHGEGEDGSDWSLAKLIRALARVEGIARLRFTTSHPLDMTDDLIEVLGELPSLMPFLHLPVQSGSDAILEAMNRRHDSKTYVRLIEKIRAARPDIALSSDFIVGFPGETEADFRATLDLISEVGFASSFSFKYSPRLGTPGAERPDQVDESVKTERLHRLQELLERQRQEFNANLVGRVTPVLFEKPGRHEGQVAGKSPYLQPVQVDGSADLIGREFLVEILRCGSNSLFGRLIDPARPPGAA